MCPSPPSSAAASSDGFRCSFCSLQFRQESHLSAHLLEDHRVLSPTRCPVCTAFVRDLPQHIALQHPHRLRRGVASNGLEITPVVTTSRAADDDDDDPLDLHRPQQLPSSSSSSASSSPVSLPLRLAAVAAAAAAVSDREPVSAAASSSHPANLLLRTTTEMLRVAAGVVPRTDSPINLSLPRNGEEAAGDKLDKAAAAAARAAAADVARKRRKQTHVPDAHKDERYWARRIKNNEAAKRSRDMRIRREKVIFDENSRLERASSDAHSQAEHLLTDNKELRLKLDLVMDENARLKALMRSYQEMASSSSSERRPFPFSE